MDRKSDHWLIIQQNLGRFQTVAKGKYRLLPEISIQRLPTQRKALFKKIGVQAAQLRERKTLPFKKSSALYPKLENYEK